MKKIALNVSGKTVYKQIRFSKQREFRNKAILNRTRSELDAQEIIEKYFILNKDFSIEFWFQFRRFDFFFPLIRTVIEIDGGYHETVSQKEYDEVTDDYLKQKHGLQIIRIKNENVKNYLDKVCQDLLKKYLLKKSNIVLDKKHKIRNKKKLDKKAKNSYNFYYKVLSNNKKEIKNTTVSVKKTILRKATNSSLNKTSK